MKATAVLTEVIPRRESTRFPDGLFGRGSTSARTTRLAIAAVAIAWVPTVLLSAFRGVDSLRSFLEDYAAQSRLLIVIPLLIISEPLLVARMAAIARHLRDEKMVQEEARPRLDDAINTLTHKADTPVTRIVMMLMAYMFLVSIVSLLTSRSLMPWCYGAGGIADFSPAGSWYILIGFPLVFFILLRWVWRQLVWLWFLGVVSRMDLRLIPSHPDKAGGLGFVEYCMRGYLPLSFAIGTVVSGGLANRIVYLHDPMARLRYIPLLVIAIVLIMCVGPLCVLWLTLRRARSRGIFAYGAFATRLGHQLEHKWLAITGNETLHPLEVQDFSATIDLYSIVANVHQMKLLPIGMQSVTRLVIAALVPAIPLAFMALPFDVIIQRVIKLLL
jgi:hypothetical protein